MRGFFSVAKDVTYKSSHHAVLSLFTAKLFQFRNVFPFDVLHFLHGYRRVFFFVSSLDRILEPELTGLQGFDRCSQIKCVVGNSRKKFFSSFLPTSLLVDVMVWWAAAPLTSSFAKPVQKCAERVILLFNVLEIIFCFAFKIRLSTSSPRKAWMAWSPHRPRVRTAPSSNPWLPPWSASHRDLSTAWRVHCPR